MERNVITYNFITKNVKVPVGILTVTLSGILIYKTYKSEKRKEYITEEILKKVKEELDNEL